MRGLRLVKLIVVATALAGAAVAYGLSGQAAAHSRAGARVAATAADSYYVLLLTNVDNNIYVGTETSLQSEHNCDLPDGGPPPCSTSIVYTVEAGPFASCAAATAAYNAAAMNPHPAFGGTKVYIFGGSYFIDDMSYWCTPGSSTTTTTTTSTSSTSAGTVPTGTCPIFAVPSASSARAAARSLPLRAGEGAQAAPKCTKKQIVRLLRLKSRKTYFAAVFVGAIGGLLGLVPGAQLPAATLIIEAGVLGVASGYYSYTADDIENPPDPAWQSIAVPQPPRIPTVASGRDLTVGEAAAITAILDADASTIGFSNALAISAERASTAAAAHDTVWVARQTSAEEVFATDAANAFAQLASVSQREQPVLSAWKWSGITIAGLQAEQRRVRTDGLPALFTEVVASLGLGQTQAILGSLKSAIASANLSQYSADLTEPDTLLVDTSEVASDLDAQKDLLGYAQYLKSSSASATATVNLTGSWTNPQTPTAPPWMLTTANSLHTLTGTFAGGAGHSGLRGTVTATLQSNNTVYAGTVHITEGTLSVGGTITITVVSQNKLEVSLKQTNLPNTQVFELDRE